MNDLDYQYIAKLVVRAQVGDSDAFAELYAATYQKLYRFACKYLHDEYLAQDAIQETYTLALKNLSTLRDPLVFVSWLNQINLRVCFNLQHANQKIASNTMEYKPELSDTLSDDDTPESLTVSVDEKEYILRQIRSLPFSESQVILLRYYNDMKIDDIAELMDISRSSVKRYLNSGRVKLSKLIKR